MKPSKIPTTPEMDRIYTEEDIANRHFVMKPCVDCSKFTKQDLRTEDKLCVCGGRLSRNGRYWSSVRTWKPSKKLSAADQKKL